MEAPISVNPTLATLEPLIGEWHMELSGASFLPDPDTKVPGSVVFEWIENGALVAMRQGDTHPPRRQLGHRPR
jgi:hypothetical protein